MDTFLDNPVNIWLAAGAFLIVLEAATAPGLGIFLAGLGALFTGVVIRAGLVSETAVAEQFIWFFGLTTLCTLLLWKPLQKFRTSRNSGTTLHNNIVGEVATVAKGGLRKNVTGQVQWSGTLMNAELAQSCEQESLPAGTRVHIIAVTGNVLTVTLN